MLQVSHASLKAARKAKQKLAGQFESDKVVDDESVSESLAVSQTKAFGEKSTLNWDVPH